MGNIIDLGPRTDGTHIMVHPGEQKHDLIGFLSQELQTELPEATRKSVKRALDNLSKS